MPWKERVTVEEKDNKIFYLISLRVKCNARVALWQLERLSLGCLIHIRFLFYTT